MGSPRKTEGSVRVPAVAQEKPQIGKVSSVMAYGRLGLLF